MGGGEGRETKESRGEGRQERGDSKGNENWDTLWMAMKRRGEREEERTKRKGLFRFANSFFLLSAVSDVSWDAVLGCAKRRSQV